jgi:hypothetical protein
MKFIKQKKRAASETTINRVDTVLRQFLAALTFLAWFL